MPILAFAVGVYLPLYTMAAVFLGGLMRFLLTRGQSPEVAESRREQGVLFGSGLVGGGGLTGVLLAVWVTVRGGVKIEGWPLGLGETVDMIIGSVAILMILGLLALAARRR